VIIIVLPVTLLRGARIIVYCITPDETTTRDGGVEGETRETTMHSTPSKSGKDNDDVHTRTIVCARVIRGDNDARCGRIHNTIVSYTNNNNIIVFAVKSAASSRSAFGSIPLLCIGIYILYGSVQCRPLTLQRFFAGLLTPIVLGLEKENTAGRVTHESPGRYGRRRLAAVAGSRRRRDSSRSR